MAKKQSKAHPTHNTAQKSSRKLIGILALAAVILVVYHIIGVVKTKGPSGLDGRLTEEPTLTATKPLLQLLSPDATGIDFKNKIVEDEQHNVIRNINFYNGGGVAVADINNDNLPDLYFICTNGKNILYLNQGNLKFKDITDAAGVGSEKGFDTAVTAADVNADGFLDLIVCRAGPEDNEDRKTKVFVNNGNLTFTDRAAEYGLADKSPSTGTNFFDYDNDGDLDCYLLNYPTDLGNGNRINAKMGPDGVPVADLSPHKPYDSDRLYRNDNGKFIDVSEQSGVWNVGFGLSASVTDLNGDGWQDIYVGNDFVQPDNCFINNGKGVFSDKLSSYFRHCSMSTMGTELSDFDNDGKVDVMAVDMWPTNNLRQKSLKTANPLSRYLTMVKYGYFEPVVRNVLQRNNGNGTFSDIACAAGIYKTDWSWSCLFADFDNDGWKDLHIANGYRREVTNRDFQEFVLSEADKKMSQNKQKDYADILGFLGQMPSHKIRNFVFKNNGNWQFDDKSGDWMTMPASWSCGGAWADLDGDGDLDLVVNNLEEPAFVYKNLSREQNKGNYLQAKLQGSPKNPFAVGASVLIECQGGQQFQELNPTHGIFSSVEHLIHFGVGQATTIDKLSVRWPDGKTQTLTNIPANQRLTLKYTDASGYVPTLVPNTPPANTLFSDRTAAANVGFSHQENSFSDFETWPLNPWTVSDLGPLTAQGDVNSDGLEDFFVGNGPSHPAAVLLQTSSGSFVRTAAAVFEQDKKYEDHGGLFFDADGDRDLDLFVLSGGAEASSPELWQCRMYLNNGKGDFSKSEGALPALKDIGLRAVAHDYDGDGDQDIFMGGRLAAKNWPLTPRSVVLQNNQGKFSDVTSQVGGDFERCGMVTDLTWADVDGDQQAELIVVGEWMPVSVFKWVNNKLQNVTGQTNLGTSNGLWNRLAVADLDQDGDLDLVTGNLGLNTRFTASPKAPFRCYAKDFDNNGTLDPVIAFQEERNIYPLVQKDVLVKQMPTLKKRFLYSGDYAKATVGHIWAKKDLDAALNLQCYGFETCWWENQGGKFIQRILPIQAQLSTTQGIVIGDFNSDGHPDLLLAGNKYGFEVETNRCDAGNGTLLVGDGKGHFSWTDNNVSGFWAMREARDLAMLRSAGGKNTFVVANNNGTLQFYSN